MIDAPRATIVTASASGIAERAGLCPLRARSRRTARGDAHRRSRGHRARREHLPGCARPRVGRVPRGRGLRLGLGDAAAAAPCSTTSATAARTAPRRVAAATSATRTRSGCPTRRRSPRAQPPQAQRRRPRPRDARIPASLPLFEALREWRAAASDGKPAYTVAHNSTLEAIAALRPSSTERARRIRGVGPAFVERHGADVLALVAQAGADYSSSSSSSSDSSRFAMISVARDHCAPGTTR